MQLMPDEILHLSFPDARLLEMQYDLEDRSLMLRFDSSFVTEVSSSGKLFGYTTVMINSWSEVQVCRHPENHAAHANSALQEVCEFYVSPTQCVIKGFAAEFGDWIEWQFESPIVMVSVEPSFE